MGLGWGDPIALAALWKWPACSEDASLYKGNPVLGARLPAGRAG